MGALTMLNESGDTTIHWSADRDSEIEAIIEKKMAEGCVFFVVEPRFGTREKLTNAADASQYRMLAIPDEDLRKFVGESGGEVVALPSPKTPAKSIRKAKTAKEVATSESVGVFTMAGRP